MRRTRRTQPDYSVSFYRVELLEGNRVIFGTTFRTLDEALDLIDETPSALDVRFSSYLKTGELFGTYLPGRTRIERLRAIRETRVEGPSELSS